MNEVDALPAQRWTRGACDEPPRSVAKGMLRKGQEGEGAGAGA